VLRRVKALALSSGPFAWRRTRGSPHPGLGFVRVRERGGFVCLGTVTKGSAATMRQPTEPAH
jgi:hypothetical protein